MREYDKTTMKVAERVFAKGDEILVQRQKRAAVIRHRAYAVSGLCAAVIVCFGAWRFSSSVKAPYDSSEIIASTETTTEIFSTTKPTTTVTASENKASTSTTSSERSAATNESSENIITRTTTAAETASRASHTVRTTASATAPRRTTALTSTTASVTVATQTEAVSETYNPVATTTVNSTQVHEVTVVSPVLTTAQVCTGFTEDMRVTTSNNGTESNVVTDIKEIFRSNPSTVEVKTSKLNYYEKLNVLISPDRIDKRRIYISDVHITRPNDQTILMTVEMYDILDISREKAVAVNLRGTDEYYLFKNPDCKVEELYS